MESGRSEAVVTLPDLTADPEVLRLIEQALREDLGPDRIDTTCAAMIAEGRPAAARLVARQSGVLAGEGVARAVFSAVDPELKLQTLIPDGSALQAGDAVLRIEGFARSILTAERTALNFIQRMTGIATLTAQYVAEAAAPKVKILDTRKTTPALRIFGKYAVRCGGGTNHRMGLYDMAMIKDNHLAYWAEHHDSSIAGAVAAVREKFPGLPVELEVDTVEQLTAALPAHPDWVLLDNMPPETLRECVALCRGICRTEASGGITLETIRSIAQTGVDAVSVGALTHSAPAADLALDFEQAE